MTDEQFLEYRKFQVEEACRMFKIEPSQLCEFRAGREDDIDNLVREILKAGECDEK